VCVFFVPPIPHFSRALQPDIGVLQSSLLALLPAFICVEHLLYKDCEVVDMDKIKAASAATSTYLREVVGELKKVTWPDWPSTARMTGIVVAMVVVIAAFLSAIDWPLGYGMQRFLGR
jgi:preprotein translocase SecE subunit